MAAFGTAAGRPLQGRGGSPGFSFTLFAVLAVVVMYLDQRAHYIERVRYVLQAAAYPIQLAVNSPPTAWRWLKESFATRDALESDNARLRARARDLELLSMRYDALARENGALRGLSRSAAAGRRSLAGRRDRQYPDEQPAAAHADRPRRLQRRVRGPGGAR